MDQNVEILEILEKNNSYKMGKNREPQFLQTLSNVILRDFRQKNLSSIRGKGLRRMDQLSRFWRKIWKKINRL